MKSQFPADRLLGDKRYRPICTGDDGLTWFPNGPGAKIVLSSAEVRPLTGENEAPAKSVLATHFGGPSERLEAEQSCLGSHGFLLA